MTRCLMTSFISHLHFDLKLTLTNITSIHPKPRNWTKAAKKPFKTSIQDIHNP